MRKLTEVLEDMRAEEGEPSEQGHMTADDLLEEALEIAAFYLRNSAQEADTLLNIVRSSRKVEKWYA